MEIKFTRHGLVQIKDSNKVPPEDVVAIPSSVKRTLAEFLREFQPKEPNPLNSELFEIARYVGEIDPLGIIDSEQQKDSEYLLEAQSVTWLFDNQMFSIESFWAIWIYYFSEEISPFKSQNDELLMAMFGEISIIFESRLTKAERDELKLNAETPWMGAGIAATKYQNSSEALISKKRKKLRNS
jgi:hypothetical protein